MSDLTIHGVTSIKVETTTKEDWFTVLKILVKGDSFDGPSSFTVNLFGKPGLSIDSDEPELPLESSVIDIREKENVA